MRKWNIFMAFLNCHLSQPQSKHKFLLHFIWKSKKFLKCIFWEKKETWTLPAEIFWQFFSTSEARLPDPEKDPQKRPKPQQVKNYNQYLNQISKIFHTYFFTAYFKIIKRPNWQMSKQKSLFSSFDIYKRNEWQPCSATTRAKNLCMHLC